ncbi:MAG: prolyl oligopeptidase family serine peptidase [Edaphobacter sp.]|uniref:S9 family peptidase n=1 Tax=Edaphobacter sp. TaxID=1934404 RepID=UPI0023A62AE1|nr:alpha/beta fold hydrolase [Edaphobacter sp.]MDE1175710.1 prolyl oligopeptidase family serine peptidase [Edaphobacter sp.]
MRCFRVKELAYLLIAASSFNAFAFSEKPLTIDDLLAAKEFAFSAAPTMSPDGKLVAYTLATPSRTETAKNIRYKTFLPTGTPRMMDGTEIRITNTETGETKEFTGSNGNAWNPIWSPDGKMLAFSSDRDGVARLWVWSRETGTLRRVSEVSLREYFDVPTWTADSRSIIVKVLPEKLTLDQADDLIEAAKNEPSSKAAIKATATVYAYDPSVPEPTAKAGQWINRSLADIAVIDVKSGSVRRLVKEHTTLGFGLSPNGRDLAVIDIKGLRGNGSQQPLYDISIVHLGSGEISSVAKDVPMDMGTSYSWSPNGEWLSYLTTQPDYMAVGERMVGECFIAPATGGPARQISSGKHPDFGQEFAGPAWSPDSRKLYVLGGNAVWGISISDSTTKEIAKGEERTLIHIVTSARSNVIASEDPAQFIIVRTRNSRSKESGFYKLSLESGRLSKLIEESKEYGPDSAAKFDMDVNPEARRVVFLSEDAQHSPDLWTTSLENFDNARRLTAINPAFDSYRFGASRLIEYQSADGQALKGALLLPSDYQPGKAYPLLVYVYGGSFGSTRLSRFGLSGMGVENKQLFATRGYAVLYPDTPLHPATPMADIAKTVIPAVNRVVELGIADPRRIGVMGHSYGGYSTLALITQSHLFRAAMASAGVGNMFSMYGGMTADGDAWAMEWAEQGQGAMGGTPWQFRDRYLENSPTFYLDKVTTPLLLVHGGADNTCPPLLSDEVFVDLRRLKKKVAYAKYANEDHWEGTWGRANKEDYLNRIVAWFDQELQAP